VLATFDPDDMSFLHVLTPDGRYVESIPLKDKVAWFDDAALREAQRAKKASLSRDIEQFRSIHGPTTEQKARRVVSNAEKLQIVNTFPAPEAEAATVQGAARPSADPHFAKAEEIQAALTTLRGQRTAATQRKTAMRGFKPADLLEPGTVSRLSGGRDSGAGVDGEETEAWDAGTGSRARPRFKAEALL
jgi:hypothetical protein